MNRANNITVRNYGLNELAHRLLMVASPCPGDGAARRRALVGTDVIDPVRSAVAACGAQVAVDMDRYWAMCRTAAEGPIDVIDLFSGCGGMSAGFSVINALLPCFRLALAADIDRVANATYRTNLQLTPLREDISDLTRNRPRLLQMVRSSKRREGHPLILIGCAPCQGFSSHRNAAGQKDARNSLFVDFARIAAVLEPDAIVVENVPELLTTAYWSYLEEARTILEAQGYSVHVSVHNMAEFGVPQERFRALILAFRKEFRPLGGFLDRGQFRTVQDAIGRLPSIQAGERHSNDPMHYSAGHKESTLRTIRAIPKNGGSRPTDAGPECLQRVKQRQGRSAYEDIYGRLYWGKPAITITAYARNPASGRFVHPEQDRGLSVREAALLQGFPSDYWFAGTLDERFRQIGNAVPPLFACYLALHVLGELLGGNLPADHAEKGITAPLGTSFSRLIPALKAGYRDVYSLQGHTFELR